MRNVTVKMEDDVARWARVKAAEEDRSLSRYLGELLGHRKRQESTYEAAMTRYFERESYEMGSPEMGMEEMGLGEQEEP